MSSTAARLPGTATLEARVLREHVASVYATHTTAILAHMSFAIAIGVFSFFTFDPLYRPVAYIWVGMLVAVDLYVLRASRWTPAEPLSRTPYWARKYARLVTLLSVATAPSGLVLMRIDNPTVTTVVIVVIMGSWTRAVQARWPLQPAMFGYGIPMMSGLIIALAWHGGALHWFLAAFGAVNLVLTLRAGVQQNRRLTDSLILRFENEALAARLSEQIAATERASAEKTRFLTTASHDLRQPMHAIALFGAALEHSLQGRPEAENAERLMRAVNALGHSLDTMLDISRLDAGVVLSQPRAMSLDALFVSINQTFSAQAEQRHLELRMRASGLWVQSDPQLLQRMLSNLVDNALKYTPRGGVSVVARARGAVVWIDVRDTGIGIPAEQLGRIFEEFYQVGNEGRDRARGLGIGLSIVQRLSRLLSHRVTVKSRPGRGALFRIELPVAEAPVAAASAPSHGEATPRAMVGATTLPSRVLLIEDEIEIRTAMTELLRSWSVELTAVADRAEAEAALETARLERAPFELLVCDFRLADGQNGLELGLHLHRQFGLALPLLLITGETSPERLWQVRASGVQVLFKPVSAASLRAALEALASTPRLPRVDAESLEA